MPDSTVGHPPKPYDRRHATREAVAGIAADLPRSACGDGCLRSARLAVQNSVWVTRASPTRSHPETVAAQILSVAGDIAWTREDRLLAAPRSANPWRVVQTRYVPVLVSGCVTGPLGFYPVAAPCTRRLLLS